MSQAAAAQPPLRYLEVVTRLDTSRLLRGVVPDDGGYRSPFLPTMRFGPDTYASFLAPARIRRGEPMQVGSARGWIVLEADSGRLAAYLGPSITALLAPVPAFLRARPNRTLAQDDAAVDRFRVAVDREAPRFFAGNEPADRGDVLDAYQDSFGPLEREAFETAAPDFFAWLRDG